MKSFVHNTLVCSTAILFLFIGSYSYAQTTSSATCSADAHVSSNVPGTNYGTSTTIPLWVNTTADYYRYFVNFNIAALSIPSNAVVYSAELRLKPTAVGEGGAGASSFMLQVVSNSWTETGVKFNAQPLTTTANQISTSSFNGTKRVFSGAPMVLLIQNIVSGITANNGFMIRRNPETTTTANCQYNSKEATTSTDRPELIIQWYIPMSITAATVTHASNSTTTNGTISPTITNGSGSFSYLWTNSAGTTVATTLNLTNVGYGWYGLRVTGTWGDVYYMAFIVGAICEPVNITFNPGPNFIDDANVFFASSTTNSGSAAVYEASGNAANDIRGLMRFRLWFDSGITPLLADLYLTGSSHLNPGGGFTNDAEFQLVTQTWSEMKVTYSNQPTFSSSILTNVPPTTSGTMSKNYDITAFWNSWRTNNPNNFGLVFKLDSYASSTARQQYHSSDAAAAGNRPYIKFIVDQPSCDRTSFTTFKRELDAGYATTFQGKLKIQFTEEYEQVAGRKVPLNLYDENKTLIASIKYDGTAIAGSALLPALTYQFDDNRYQMNLSTYSLVVGKYYILELTKSTGEKEYIRFVYTN